MDEQSLVEAARRGDVPAFNQLVLRYQGMTYNVAFRILGEGAAAEDATQEAFLAAYRAIGTLRGCSFQAWLLRIVTNKCRDQMRAAWRRTALSLDALLVEPDRLFCMADPRESSYQTAEHRSLADTLHEAILTLPPDQRTVLVLADVQGLTYREVAEVLGTSMGTVRSRLSRARARLRDQLFGQRDVLPAWVHRSRSAASECGPGVQSQPGRRKVPTQPRL